jgi:hypothetical protein
MKMAFGPEALPGLTRTGRPLRPGDEFPFNQAAQFVVALPRLHP